MRSSNSFEPRLRLDCRPAEPFSFMRLAMLYVKWTFPCERVLPLTLFSSPGSC